MSFSPYRRVVGNALRLSVCLVFSILLAGCGSTGQVASAPSATPTAIPTSLPTVPTTTPTPTPTLEPSAPQPTPIAPQGWATHTSTSLHYTIQYPTNWITSGDFDVWNYDPQQYQGTIQPPLLKIEVLPLDNPSQLSPLQFYTQDQQGVDVTPCADPTTHATTVGGHDALEAVCPSQSKDGYYVTDGAKMLYIYQLNAANGQPSSVFTQMIESFTFTS